MAWGLSGWNKKLFGTPYSVSGVRPALSRSVVGDRSLPSNRYALGAGAAGKPTVQYGGGQAGMFKNPLGKMSPEELKDFQEVLKEMRLDMKPEFVPPGRTNQPQMGSFKHQPFLFDEATAAEYQRRRKFNPYV